MQMSTEEFFERLENLEPEEYGDDGEPIREYTEDDPMDEWHSRTDTMTDEELKAYRDKLRSYERINEFMNSKGYKSNENYC